MLDLGRLAYGVDADKIAGGPSWLDYDRFEVVAKAAAGTRPEALQLMLQALLADRFGLVVAAETKPMPAYVLTAPKGQSKLKSAEVGAGGCTQNLVLPLQPNPELGGIQLPGRYDGGFRGGPAAIWRDTAGLICR